MSFVRKVVAASALGAAAGALLALLTSTATGSPYAMNPRPASLYLNESTGSVVVIVQGEGGQEWYEFPATCPPQLRL